MGEVITSPFPLFSIMDAPRIVHDSLQCLQNIANNLETFLNSNDSNCLASIRRNLAMLEHKVKQMEQKDVEEEMPSNVIPVDFTSSDNSAA